MADKILRLSNLATFLAKLKSLFVAKETGKGLSTNDYTSAEKNKLAGIASGANNYSLPTASANTLGGVKIGANLTITNGVLSANQGSVDLTPYAKKTDLSSYATTAALNSYAKTTDLSVYAKSADIASTYAKKSDISTVYKYKGSVDSYSVLPANGMAVGDVYNVVAADSANGIKAGDNVVWNGNSWDNLSGVVDLSAYAKSSDIANTYMKTADYPTATDDDINGLFTTT